MIRNCLRIYSGLIHKLILIFTLLESNVRKLENQMIRIWIRVNFLYKVHYLKNPKMHPGNVMNREYDDCKSSKTFILRQKKIIISWKFHESEEFADFSNLVNFRNSANFLNFGILTKIDNFAIFYEFYELLDL